MEPINKQNLHAAALYNSGQESMKSDTDKEEKWHRICLSNRDDLSMAGTSVLQSHLQLSNF